MPPMAAVDRISAAAVAARAAAVMAPAAMAAQARIRRIGTGRLGAFSRAAQAVADSVAAIPVRVNLNPAARILMDKMARKMAGKIMDGMGDPITTAMAATMQIRLLSPLSSAPTPVSLRPMIRRPELAIRR